MNFLNITFIDIIDIVLVAILIYQLYKIIKGTVAINIFFGLSVIYLLWKVVEVLNLQLLTEILGQFIGIGVLILAIVFQQELRRFLMMIGKSKIIKNKGIFNFNLELKNDQRLNFNAISAACRDMSKNKTGAIIIITQIDDLAVFCENGVEMNADISQQMIESIFYKNSPLHDGAIIIRDNKIISAKCILPISNSDSLPNSAGTRHRAALGISEESDAISIIVSEETGNISYIKDGEIFNNRTPDQLKDFLKRTYEAY